MSEARNYHEDYPDENGNYVHECPKCGNRFRGHKRRWDCKACHLQGLEEMAMQVNTGTHPALKALAADHARLQQRVEDYERMLGEAWSIEINEKWSINRCTDGRFSLFSNEYDDSVSEHETALEAFAAVKGETNG
jgi:ribosomal protein S27AE